jgi:hypothetical protein
VRSGAQGRGGEERARQGRERGRDGAQGDEGLLLLGAAHADGIRRAALRDGLRSGAINSRA